MYTIKSPNEKIEVSFYLENGIPFYSATKNEKIILKKSTMGISIKGYDDLKWKDESVEENSFFETWNRVWGQSSAPVENNYNESIFTLKGDFENSFDMKIIFRCFNDGFAFRYEWEKQNSLKYMEILEDNTEFVFTKNLSLFHSNDGDDSQSMNNGALSLQTFVKGNSPVTMPFENTYICLHEANLFNFEKVVFIKGDKENSLKLKTKSISVTPHVSPWRVVLITDTLEELVLSSTIENLNPACAIEDTSWIKTGKSMWDWRNHGAVYPDFTYDLNTESMKKYIDFASENNIQFILIDDNWHPFARDIDKVRPLEPIAELDMPAVMEYAKSKDISVLLYVNDEAFVYNDIDAILSTYASWGAVGIKHGFMGTHGQRRSADTIKIAQKCAKYHLMYVPHEPERPWGMHRTYPNLISTEYINALYDGPKRPEATPTALTIVPFTNAITSPLDRSCGMFDMDSAHTRKACRKEALTTVSSQMAECVIVFSGLLTLPDNPHAYTKKKDLFEFIKAMPAMTWDETKVLNSIIGQYVTIARRSGDEWFIGGLTNESPRTLVYKFDFLQDIDYTATIYSDTIGSNYKTNREAYEVKQINLRKDDCISVDMAAGGGATIWIRPVNNN